MIHTPEVFADCDECDQKKDLESLLAVCYECDEIRAQNTVKTFVIALFKRIENDNKDHCEDDTFIIGFDSEKEKQDYMKSYKSAAAWLVHEIVMEALDYNLDVNDDYEKCVSSIEGQEITAKLTNHDKYRCETCQGDGWIRPQV